MFPLHLLALLLLSSSAVKAKWAAVLLTGQARSFNRTICSFQSNIIVPLQAMGYDVHIFAVAPADGSASQLQMLRLIKEAHTHIELTQPMEFPEQCTNYTMLHYHQPSLHWWGKKRYTYVFLEQVYLKWRAEELRKEYESKTGLHFQWVIWLRPDVLYADPIPPLHGLNSSYMWVPRWGSDFKGINDRALIATSALSSTYLNLYKGLCIDNLPFPHNFPSERIHRWFVRQEDATDSIAFLDNFRFMRLRMSQHLPMDSESVEYFQPSTKRCRNFFTMKEAWWVRSLQLQCSDVGTLTPVSQQPLEVPRCVLPNQQLSAEEALAENRLVTEERTSVRYQQQPIKQATKLNPIKRLQRNARLQAMGIGRR